MQLLRALVASAMAVASVAAQSRTSPDLFQLPRCDTEQLSAIVESADGQECKRVSSLMIMAPAPASDSGRERGCQSDACRRMVAQFRAKFPAECTIPAYRMNGLYRLQADLLSSISDCPQTTTAPTTSAPATIAPAPAPATTAPAPGPATTAPAPSPTSPAPQAKQPQAPTPTTAMMPAQNASSGSDTDGKDAASSAGSGLIESPSETKQDSVPTKPVVPKPTQASAAHDVVQPAMAVVGAVAVTMALLL
ncbi:hypothetical protein P43SY_000289 [Pythium insidiosum]|uniref:Elicitin-like protein n=1 Tax=Pythium insidiosum TaxID=114742 RepID=A0AAD5MA88_PYTIN|nr:hypothetical protein P43SY_000289 [Pythium insidiosum]